MGNVAEQLFDNLKDMIDEKLGFTIERSFDSDEDYASFIEKILKEHFDKLGE